MGNHFHGSYHWDFYPLEDRAVLLDALEVFCDEDTNLFIESLSPSIRRRFSFWRMRSGYRTHLRPDTLSPQPSVFHITLNRSNLEKLKAILKKDGLNENSIAHIKGYSGDQGLFWFHGFCDTGDQTLSCSHHVTESQVQELEVKLGLKAEKKFGELRSDREMREEVARILDAMEQYHETEPVRPAKPPKAGG